MLKNVFDSGRIIVKAANGGLIVGVMASELRGFRRFFEVVNYSLEFLFFGKFRCEIGGF